MSITAAILSASLAAAQLVPAQDGRIPPVQIGGAQLPVSQRPSLPSDADLARIDVAPELLRLVRALDAESFADRASARAAIVARRAMPDELMALLIRKDLSIEARHALVGILRDRIVNAPRGALGVRMEQFVERQGGVRVIGLVAGMPAEKKLVVGDVLRSVNGTPLVTSLDLTRVVQSLPPGLEVKVGVRRVKRDAAGKALVGADGLELTEELDLALRLGSTDELAEKGDQQGGVANAVSIERQAAAEEAARRFLPQLPVVRFKNRPEATDAPIQPASLESVRSMLMELQLSGGDPDLVRLHRQRLDFLTQQFAAAKDELSRRALQQSLEALASEIRGSF
jgi:hypothetical protein